MHQILEAARAQVDEDRQFLVRVEGLKAVPWIEAEALKTVLGDVTDETLAEEIVPRVITAGRPDATNCAELPMFKQCFWTLFSKTESLKSKQDAYKTHLMNYQLYLFKATYMELQDEKRTVHEYIWHALKAAQGSKKKDKEAIVKHMIHDFQRFSLVPHGRKETEKNPDDVEGQAAVDLDDTEGELLF